jgi:hypothetical protein
VLGYLAVRRSRQTCEHRCCQSSSSNPKL